VRYEVRVGGYGGQGVITMGQLLGMAASTRMRLVVAMTQSYGPEARGGSCRADVIISDYPIDYPKITDLDCLIAMNKESFMLYVDDVKKGGSVIFDNSLYKLEDREAGVTHFAVPATRIARELGNPQVANVVMLGAIAKVTNTVSVDALGEVVRDRFPNAAEKNLRALGIGYKSVRKLKGVKRPPRYR